MKLTIKNAVVLASVVLAAGFAAALGVNTMALSQLRVGGPVYLGLKGDFDLLADILPPPLYVIEPYLEATLALNDAGRAQAHGQRLVALHKDYEARKVYWQSRPHEESKRSAIDAVTRTADVFWQEADATFVPALARNDLQSARQSYRNLSRDYAAHRDAINRLVSLGNASLEYGQAGADRASAVYQIATWSISLLVLGLLIAAIFGCMKFVVNPLLRFAGATEDLAQGRLETEIPALGRHDEMGKLAHAMETFRDKLMAAEHANVAQTELIVSSIGTGLDHLAKGDLTHRVTADLTGAFAKLKEDFNTAMTRLQETVKNVLVSTHQIGTGADEISTAADDLSRRTEQQAASLEETAAALEQITAMVKRTAANAKQASHGAVDAQSAAADGGGVAETAVAAMEAISQSSKQITDIIGVIDEIAFQTNLLALNAGVEAARAGDAGRGFAVVASEVRALAQRSSHAAKEIKTIITKSGEQVGEGVKYVGETGRALKRIVEQIVMINELVSEMAQAAEQQASGIEQVNAAVGQMDQVTQQNAAMVEQSTAASRSLSDETKDLIARVGFFAVGEEPAAAAPRALSRGTPVPAKPVAAKRVAAAGRRPSTAAPSRGADGDSWAEF
jgi:methyl-accepting chemotaxis protein